MTKILLICNLICINLKFKFNLFRTNRSLKAEPLVTIAALKSYLTEHFTKTNNISSSTSCCASSNFQHYTRPPTAASLKIAKKLPKYIEKIASNVSSATSDLKKKNNNNTEINSSINSTPFGGFSATTTTNCDNCLEKVFI
jgi:hypothetical protein